MTDATTDPAPRTSADAAGASPVPGTGADAPLVELHDVTYAYHPDSPAVEDLTFRLLPGDALALIGPNGAGKSTLLKGLLGLVPRTAGTAHILGDTGRRRGDGIGYMPQTDDIDPEFPVSLRQVVMMGRYRRLGPLRWPGRVDRDAVDHVLERVGLADRADARFGSLSGGQQQRGMLARALVSEPRLLLLDEPFNGLDRTNREKLLETLRELRDEGVGIVVSTHDFELARIACSHVLLVNRTQIAAGTVEDTLTPDCLRRVFAHASADEEAHSHFHHAHGHYHDPDFRGLPDDAGTPPAGSIEDRG